MAIYSLAKEKQTQSGRQIGRLKLRKFGQRIIAI
jgi:hypothetical protein